MAQGPAATFHVYVDPIFGDDAMAFHLNPGAAGSPISRQPMARYPANFPEPGNQTDGFLQHAPYSFRTLSGGQPPGSGNFGALSYLATVFPGNGPWVNEDTGEAVHWIVIHCLPGLYGPVTEDGEFDIVGTSNTFASHFRFNGEVFPIDLRNRVNIQGTSALDTVFDARDTATAIFRAWDPLYNGPTFVDSLTVRGARSDNGEVGEGPNRNDSGAAFSIRRWNSENAELRNSLTISNCFIVENDVGIAIENDVFPEGDDQVATPVIVNNTIAWNTIGIWSGNTDASQPGIGVAQPVILNNIIDPGIIDHEPHRWGALIHGVRVMGGATDIAMSASMHGVEMVLVSLVDLDPVVLREITEACNKLGLEYRLVPALSDLLEQATTEPLNKVALSSQT